MYIYVCTRSKLSVAPHTDISPRRVPRRGEFISHFRTSLLTTLVFRIPNTMSKWTSENPDFSDKTKGPDPIDDALMMITGSSSTKKIDAALEITTSHSWFEFGSAYSSFLEAHDGTGVDRHRNSFLRRQFSRGSTQPILFPTSWISAAFPWRKRASPSSSSPKNILKTTGAQPLHCNERVYSKDTTGSVALIVARKLRALVAWKARKCCSCREGTKRCRPVCRFATDETDSSSRIDHPDTVEITSFTSEKARDALPNVGSYPQFRRWISQPQSRRTR